MGQPDTKSGTQHFSCSGRHASQRFDTYACSGFKVQQTDMAVRNLREQNLTKFDMLKRVPARDSAQTVQPPMACLDAYRRLMLQTDYIVQQHLPNTPCKKSDKHRQATKGRDGGASIQTSPGPEHHPQNAAAQY